LEAFRTCLLINTFVFKDNDFLGVRRVENGEPKEYVWESHNTVRRRVENYAKGLKKLGLGRQEALGVYGVNRPEWVMKIHSTSVTHALQSF
jgi:long-subunit acyl-CoA synthetase (AMP-forming)